MAREIQLKLLLACVLLFCTTSAHTADSEALQPDKHITFYSSYGYQRQNQWHIPFRVWVKDSYKDFWKLAGLSGSATVAQKSAQIERLLRHFPQRLFVLIGDSGEHDPEIFRALRLRYPEQIVTIKIRDVVNAAQEQAARLDGMSVISPDGKTCD